MPLDPVAQQLDFSLGAFQSGALEREPAGAAETIVGLLGADGLPYRRGGSVFKSNAASGSSGLLWVADAQLLGGRRTVFQRVGDTAWRVLDVDDATPTVITWPGLGGMGGTAQPFRPPVNQGVMQLSYVAGQSPRFYAGSRKTADYSTGTVQVVKGDTKVVGAGTSWLANVDAGMFLVLPLPGYGSTVPIRSVESDTQLTLAWPYTDTSPSTLGGPSTYTISPALSNFDLSEASVTNPVAVSGAIHAALADRFVWAEGNLVRFTKAGFLRLVAGEDHHAFATDVRGLGVLRDVLLVFTASGVYAVSGMAYPLVDPGSGDPLQRDELVNADVIAWGHEGIASWAGALVVPALDNVFLMDSLGAPTPIGERILDLYLSYVRAGYVPGVAEVYNGHYFLPILNPASSYAWVDTLVCRLQPSHSGNNFAWTQVTGDGASVTGFAERQTVPPLLLGASRLATSRVLDCSAFFKPTGAVKNDASGNSIPFTVTTIDYPTGNSVSNFVHKVRLRYELTDAAADNPTITAVAAVDGGAGGNTFALSGVAVEDVGEKVWRVNRHAKNVKFTFSVLSASASCKIKSVEVFVRHSGKQ